MGVERRFEAAAQAFAVHPSLGAAGVAVARTIRRRAFVARRDRAAPSPLLYVDANVSVSHTDHRPGFDEPVHRTGGSYNREEEAVPLGSDAVARAPFSSHTANATTAAVAANTFKTTRRGNLRVTERRLTDKR